MKLEDLETKLGIANLGEEEKLALVKDIQANLPALKAEQRTLEAKTQANLVVEAIKKIKEGLEARFDELNGIVDVKVRDITSGKDGKDGKDGKNGVDGKDGKDGISITGPKGADGKDGEDGVGVQDAHIDFDGSLIITLTTGKELNVGEVVPMDVAEKIKVIGNGGGTSQSVLDAIAAINTTIATYGTMATQNANNVAITGGNINNVTIGGTTPAAGTFTTLISNSTAQFGKGSANYVQAVGGATTVAPVVSALGSDTNIPLVLQPKGAGALQAQQTDSTATGGNARGANAVDWQMQRSIAGQVASSTYGTIAGGSSNQVTGAYGVVAGGVLNVAASSASFVGAGNSNYAGSNSYASVVGGFSNTSSGYCSFVGGGNSNTVSGYYNVLGGGFTNSATSGSAVTTQSGTMNGTTAVTLSGSNGSIKVGQYITGTSIAGDTYVAAISGTSLTLSKNASGSSTSTLSFYTPHGVVVGGGNNQATGSYSFIGGGGDAGTAANRNVASGDWSVVVGGYTNSISSAGFGSAILGGTRNSVTNSQAVICGGDLSTASGYNSFIGGGYFNTTSGALSTIPGGSGGSTRSIYGAFNYAATYNSARGDSQLGIYVLSKASTTDATPTVLTTNFASPSGSNQVILPNNSAYYFRGTVVAGVTGGGNTKGWYVEGVIKRGANAAATALVGTPTVTSSYADAGASTWTIAITADTTNGGLAVTFTGQAGTTIRTVAQISTTEMTF